MATAGKLKCLKFQNALSPLRLPIGREPFDELRVSSRVEKRKGELLEAERLRPRLGRGLAMTENVLG